MAFISMEHNYTHHYTCIIFLVLSISCLFLKTSTSTPPGGDPLRNGPAENWLNHGGDLYNRRYAEGESKINPSTASKLRLKWRFYTGHDVSATPAVFGGVVYFPSWNGNLYAVRAADGSLVWRRNLKALTGLSSNISLSNNTSVIVSRSTPTVVDDKLIIGIYGPTYVVAVKRATEQLMWKTQLDKHPAALITMSGTYYGRAFYVGVSSLEEIYTIENCCTFRGSFVKLNPQNGAVLWQTYMIPDNGGRRDGYSGAAIWGSSPSMDPARRHVYVATWNLYTAPESVEACQERQNNQTVPAGPEACVGPDIHFDSILALHLDNGAIEWHRQLGGYDVWFFACRDPTTPGCPSIPSPDADFGEAPMMMIVYLNRTKVLDIIIISDLE